MSNWKYRFGMGKILDRTVDLTGTVKAQMIRTVAGAGAGGSTVYAPSQSADQHLSDIPSNIYCRAGSAIALGTKTYSNGQFGAATIDFGATASGDAIQGIVLYWDPGTGDANCVLLAWFDTATGTPGLPVTPDGGDIQYAEASYLFAIV